MRQVSGSNLKRRVLEASVQRRRRHTTSDKLNIVKTINLLMSLISKSDDKMDRLRILLMGFLFLIMLAPSFSAEKVFGSVNDLPNFSVSIERKIEVLNGGYIMVNDTFFLTTNLQLPSFYLVGLAKNYSKNLVYLSARDAYGFLQIEISEEEDSFKWFKIFLRTEGRRPYNFTLTTVFSDLVRRKSGYVFRAEFPLYPVLRDRCDFCNVTLILPPEATALPNGFPREVFINVTSDFRLFNNLTRSLPAYMDFPSWVEFLDATFSILRILELRRDISIDGWGKIYVTDLYDVEMINVNSFSVILPPGSTGISVYDIYEKYPNTNILIKEVETYGVFVNVLLSDKLKNHERTRIAVVYLLPYWGCINREGWQRYTLSINITRPHAWILQRLIISILLPEGASIIRGDYLPQAEYEKVSFFQERVTFKYHNLTLYEDFPILVVKYQYSPLWVAFRPTILVMTLMGLVGIIIVFTKLSSKGTPTATFSSEVLRAFIQAYEEMERVSLKLESLQEEYLRGRIPKRRYQSMRRMFEEELHMARRKIMDLKSKIETFGGRYVGMIEQLEKASLEIDFLRRRIEEADFKLRRGEISIEEHHGLIEEYRRRIEKARASIEEVILRLKEEI